MNETTFLKNAGAEVFRVENADTKGDVAGGVSVLWKSQAPGAGTRIAGRASRCEQAQFLRREARGGEGRARRATSSLAFQPL